MEEFLDIRKPTGGDINRKSINLHHAIVITDIVVNKATGVSSPNRSNMLYDNGDGTLISGGSISGSGSINYKTGEIIMRGCPKNAEFVVCVAYDSAHSGGLASAAATGYNIVSNIGARSVSAKLNTVVEVRGYS